MPWTASIPFMGTTDAIFEYACHEGNYGMAGMLAGHRAQEAASKEIVPDPAVFFQYQNLVCEDLPSASGG